MASNLRKKVVASRRRREDEGEEEGSVLGEMEDDSLSEGSIISHGDDDADIEPSDISEDDISKTQSNEHGVALDIANLASTGKEEAPNPQATDSKFTISSDTKAMMNGLKLTDTKHVPEVDFDEVTVDATDSAVEDSRPQAKTPRETPAERSRREHLEYLRQQNENPAFVPNRGGFFLHDNRAAPGQNGFRGSAKGRGRGGFNGFHRYIPLISSC